MTNAPSPGDFREEILKCLIEHSSTVQSTGDPDGERDVRRSLEEAFIESGGDYDNPDYKDLLEAMKKTRRPGNENREGYEDDLEQFHGDSQKNQGR